MFSEGKRKSQGNKYAGCFGTLLPTLANSLPGNAAPGPFSEVTVTGYAALAFKLQRGLCQFGLSPYELCATCYINLNPFHTGHLQ